MSDNEILVKWKNTTMAQFINLDSATAGKLLDFAKFYHREKNNEIKPLKQLK